jgi:hypothetical protein
MWRTNWRRFIALDSDAYGDQFALGFAGSLACAKFAGGFDYKLNCFLQVAASLG